MGRGGGSGVGRRLPRAAVAPVAGARARLARLRLLFLPGRACLRILRQRADRRPPTLERPLHRARRFARHAASRIPLLDPVHPGLRPRAPGAPLQLVGRRRLHHPVAARRLRRHARAHAPAARRDRRRTDGRRPRALRALLLHLHAEGRARPARVGDGLPAAPFFAAIPARPPVRLLLRLLPARLARAHDGRTARIARKRLLRGAHLHASRLFLFLPVDGRRRVARLSRARVARRVAARGTTPRRAPARRRRRHRRRLACALRVAARAPRADDECGAGARPHARPRPLSHVGITRRARARPAPRRRVARSARVATTGRPARRLVCAHALRRLQPTTRHRARAPTRPLRTVHRQLRLGRRARALGRARFEGARDRRRRRKGRTGRSTSWSPPPGSPGRTEKPGNTRSTPGSGSCASTSTAPSIAAGRWRPP